MYKISELSHASKELDSFYSELHEILIPLLNTQSFFVCLREQDTELISFPYLYDHESGASFNLDVDQEKLKSSLIAKVLISGKPLMLNKKQFELLHKGTGLKFGRIPSFWFAVPFEINNKLIGAVAVQSSEINADLAKREQALISYVSRHLCEAIRHRIQQDQLQYQALHDSITGLPNRSLFIDRVDHALRLVRRVKDKKMAILF